MKARAINFFRLAVARVLFWQLRRLIKRHDIKVVAVAGSVGKTTTKLAIASALEAKYHGRVLAHPGNYNMEISVPLSIFGLDVPRSLTNPLAWLRRWRQVEGIISQPKFKYQVVIIELGIDRIGQMGFYASQIKPDVAVLTAITPEHMEYFGDIETVASEEFKIVPASRVAILNGEDEQIAKIIKQHPAAVQTYGVHTGTFHFRQVERHSDFRLAGELVLAEAAIKIKTSLISQAGLAALAAAAAVAEEFGLEPAEIKAGLVAFVPVAGRMQLLTGKHSSHVLDDSYNSSPAATAAALETLYDIKSSGHKIAILGSMNELGEGSPDAHRQIGKLAAKVDILVTVGDDAAKHLASGAAEAGLSAKKIHLMDSPYAAGRLVADMLKANDVVLVKGSQNRVFTEEAAAILLADASQRKRLVRQDSNWQQIKREQFEDFE